VPASHPDRRLALYPPNGIPFYLKSMPPEVLKQLRQPAVLMKRCRT